MNLKKKIGQNKYLETLVSVSILTSIQKMIMENEGRSRNSLHEKDTKSIFFSHCEMSISV